MAIKLRKDEWKYLSRLERTKIVYNIVREFMDNEAFGPLQIAVRIVDKLNEYDL